MNPYSNSPGTSYANCGKVCEDKIDIILSSVRPFGQNEEYDALQLAALDSWFNVTKKVMLFNLPGDTGGLELPGLFYVGPDANPPSIKQLLGELRSNSEDDVVAIVNSDIVLGSLVAKLPKAVMDNSLGRAWACTSFRWPTGGIGIGLGEPTDKGLDFFCSTVRIWNDMVKQIPGVLTLGRPLWDNWVNSFFHVYLDPAKYFDITQWRCVFHPKHGEHFRLSESDKHAVMAAAQTIHHPGGLPRRKLGIPK